MIFLPLLLVMIAGVISSFIIADMKKDHMMAQYRREVARIEWQNALASKEPYETEVYVLNDYLNRKCS